MKLTHENYHSPVANQKYFSASQFRDFTICESMAVAKIKRFYTPPPNAAMLVGSYVDAHFSSSLELFRGHHPEIFTKKGDLKSNFQTAEKMIERLEEDEFVMNLIRGASVQDIASGEIKGVPFKIKTDFLIADKMVIDLKTTKSFSDIWSDSVGAKVPWWYFWGYHFQMAIYCRITGIDRHGIIAVTKEAVPDIAAITLVDEVIKEANNEIDSLIGHYAEVKSGAVAPSSCGCCDWCKSQKKLDQFAWTSFD